MKSLRSFYCDSENQTIKPNNKAKQESQTRPVQNLETGWLHLDLQKTSVASQLLIVS